MIELKDRPRSPQIPQKVRGPQCPTDEISVALRALQASVAGGGIDFLEKFNALLQVVRPFAYAIVTRRLFAPSLRNIREDVVQEFFIKLSQPDFLARYNPSRPGRPWIAMVLNNLAIDHRRKEQVAGSHVLPFSSAFPRSDICRGGSIDQHCQSSNGVGPLQVLEQAEFGKRVRDIADKVIEAQPEKNREVWGLLQQGLKYGEIARAAGCPEGTVKSRISSTRQALRDALIQGGVSPSEYDVDS